MVTLHGLIHMYRLKSKTKSFLSLESVRLHHVAGRMILCSKRYTCFDTIPHLYLTFFVSHFLELHHGLIVDQMTQNRYYGILKCPQPPMFFSLFLKCIGQVKEVAMRKTSIGLDSTGVKTS